MPNQQPTITDARGKRQFAASAAAVLGFVVNPEERILLLAHPKRAGMWEVINGALDAAETVLDGALREVHEEAGAQLELRPLGIVHAYTFRYDDNVQYMISLCYLFAYEGGPVEPGDDMAGSAIHWASVDEIESGALSIYVPEHSPWLFRRAVELYRLWHAHPPLALQPPFTVMKQPKYKPR